LAVGSGFVPLNFVVLQIYIFGPRGLSANVMWLICSLSILLIYALTAYRTQADLFTYFSLGAIASALTAGLVLLDGSMAQRGSLSSRFTFTPVYICRTYPIEG
jgi:hypothetical protein